MIHSCNVHTVALACKNFRKKNNKENKIQTMGTVVKISQPQGKAGPSKRNFLTYLSAIGQGFHCIFPDIAASFRHEDFPAAPIV
jgi:hypothetical protein